MKRPIRFKDKVLKAVHFRDFSAFRKWVYGHAATEFSRFLFPRDMNQFMYVDTEKEMVAIVDRFLDKPYTFDKARFLEESDGEEEVVSLLSRYSDGETLIDGKIHQDDHGRTIIEIEPKNTYLDVLNAALGFFSDSFPYLIGGRLIIFAC